MKRLFLVLSITALLVALFALSQGMSKNSTPDVDDDAVIPSTATWKPAPTTHPQPAATPGAASSPTAVKPN
jgi:hypothetical protein